MNHAWKRASVKVVLCKLLKTVCFAILDDVASPASHRRVALASRAFHAADTVRLALLDNSSSAFTSWLAHPFHKDRRAAINLLLTGFTGS